MKREAIKKILGIASASCLFIGLALSISVAFSLIMILAVLLHEYGHYYFARKEGIYKGYEISMMPQIHLAKLGSKILYLAGFAFSLLPLPLFFIWTIDIGISVNFSLLYAGMALVLSSLDFLVILFYGKLKK